MQRIRHSSLDAFRDNLLYLLGQDRLGAIALCVRLVGGPSVAGRVNLYMGSHRGQQHVSSHESGCGAFPYRLRQRTTMVRKETYGVGKSIFNGLGGLLLDLARHGGLAGGVGAIG